MVVQLTAVLLFNHVVTCAVGMKSRTKTISKNLTEKSTGTSMLTTVQHMTKGKEMRYSYAHGSAP